MGFFRPYRKPVKEKRKTKSLPFYSVSVKSIADRLLPSRACFLFLFTKTKLINII